MHNFNYIVTYINKQFLQSKLKCQLLVLLQTQFLYFLLFIVYHYTILSLQFSHLTAINNRMASQYVKTSSFLKLGPNSQVITQS